jgi:formylglycine-generating enzyme required for sulfatase activity
MVRVAVALLSLMLFWSTAHAEKRVALVIGNGAYAKVPKLDNPKNDAAAMEAMFKAAGFDAVVRANDLGVAAMRRALRDFSDTAHDADIAIVFYAGHGMEVSGTNYLIPTDAVLERDIDVQDEAVSLDRVNQIFESVKVLRLVILDACRDNPFIRSMRRTLATRTVRSGYGEIDERSLPPNTLVAYAQRAGATAEDGAGANSPYTTALLKHLPTPGLDIELALRRVRDEVLKTTKNRQEPFKYGSLGGAEIALVTAKSQLAAAPETKVPPVSDAAREWSQVDKTSIAELETFARRHGASPEAEYARARSESLRQQQAASTARPSEPAKQGLVPGLLKETVGIILPRDLPPRCDGIEMQVGTEKRCLNPKDTFRDCETCPEMVVIPAGEFMMGSPPGEPERDTYEDQVRITIARPFAVGRFAVTFAEWDACSADSGCNGYKPSDEGRGRDTHPVINVSWDDAKSFVAWLSKKAGKTYRLLSESEREYVARAGTTTPFWWGSSITPEQANYNGSAEPYKGGGSKGEYRKRTVVVNSFAPNPWGLYNVHGNVWEWTEDCWNDRNSSNPGNGKARTLASCDRHVLRGGSLYHAPKYLRSASRFHYSTGHRDNGFSFRVARSLVP